MPVSVMVTASFGVKAVADRMPFDWAGEHQRLLLTYDDTEYASMPQVQIVPALGDQEINIGIESSFYQVLHPTARCNVGPNKTTTQNKTSATAQDYRSEPPLELGRRSSPHHYPKNLSVNLFDDGQLPARWWPVMLLNEKIQQFRQIW